MQRLGRQQNGRREDKLLKLNEDSLTPLYQQLMEDIKCAIEEGKYKYEDKIPSEPELSELYSVSRITVRRAVDELCTEGYLIKKQGKGTYVGHPKLQRKIERADDAMSFSDMCRANGMKHSVRVTAVQHVPARQDEIKFLDLAPGATLLYIQRVHYADGEPIQIENNFYPLERFRFLEKEDLEHGSLFHLLYDQYGINPFGTMKTTLEIVRASAQHASLLDVPVGEPLFYMNAYFVDENSAPLFVGRQYIAGGRYVFHI